MNSTLKYSALLLSFGGITFASFISPIAIDTTIGIRTETTFDYQITNTKNNIEFFNNTTNFFEEDGLVFNENTNSFLDTVRSVITAKPVNRVQKAAPLTAISQKNYDLFGAARSFTVDRDTSFSGVGVKTGKVSQIDGIEEGFEVFGGDNNSGSSVSITMQVREKSYNERHGAHNHLHNGAQGGHTSSSVIGHSPLVSSVMRVHGMGIQEASADGRVKTNPFALVGTYRQEDFDATYSLSELQELINGCLFLGWLNTALDGDHLDITDDDRWVHAVQGNFDNMPDNPNRHDEHGVIGNAVIGTLDQNIAGTQTSIPGLSKLSGEIRVGDHGGDDLTNTVWAVVDHNSDFAVIPEPSTYALIAGFAVLIFALIKRRK